MNLRNLRNLLVNTVLAVLAFLGAVFLMDKALDANEQDTCWRVQRQHDMGYPVTAPDWCEGK